MTFLIICAAIFLTVVLAGIIQAVENSAFNQVVREYKNQNNAERDKL